MPFQPNSANDQDGAVGTTTASDRCGLVGLNNGTSNPPAGTPGGAGVLGVTTIPEAAGVFGANNSSVRGEDGFLHGAGVHGNGPSAGVSGYSNLRHGVQGITGGQGAGVYGRNDSSWAAGLDIGSGVVGVTNVGTGAGVYGVNATPFVERPADAVIEFPASGVGVAGHGSGIGVKALSERGTGVLAQSINGSGLVATSDRGQAVTAFSFNDIALFAEGGGFAAVFNGAVVVNPGPRPRDRAIEQQSINGSLVINEGSLFVNRGDVVVANADCAEDFSISVECEPGTVMVLTDQDDIAPCSSAYDKRVVGVVSGAGGYKPGLILDRRPDRKKRAPVSLLGKVYCRVDADFGRIERGDLLTTSPNVGHAMRASDCSRAFGAVLGKALEPRDSGTGLIAVLIALQ